MSTMFDPDGIISMFIMSTMFDPDGIISMFIMSKPSQFIYLLLLIIKLTSD